VDAAELGVPVVWNVLYVMMGVSLWLLWDRPGDLAARPLAIIFFFTGALEANLIGVEIGLGGGLWVPRMPW
jgi:tryptophan-rich sensory protein